MPAIALCRTVPTGAGTSLPTTFPHTAAFATVARLGSGLGASTIKRIEARHSGAHCDWWVAALVPGEAVAAVVAGNTRLDKSPDHTASCASLRPFPSAWFPGDTQQC